VREGPFLQFVGLVELMYDCGDVLVLAQEFLMVTFDLLGSPGFDDGGHLLENLPLLVVGVVLHEGEIVGEVVNIVEIFICIPETIFFRFLLADTAKLLGRRVGKRQPSIGSLMQFVHVL